MADEGEVRNNKKVVLRRHITGFPKETDMELVTTETVQLAIPEGSTVVIIKNLYLSCDPYMRWRMSKQEEPNDFPDFLPGSVSVAVEFLANLVQNLKDVEDRMDEVEKLMKSVFIQSASITSLQTQIQYLESREAIQAKELESKRKRRTNIETQL